MKDKLRWLKVRACWQAMGYSEGGCVIAHRLQAGSYPRTSEENAERGGRRREGAVERTRYADSGVEGDIVGLAASVGAAGVAVDLRPRAALKLARAACERS